MWIPARTTGSSSPPVPGGETSEPPKFYAFCVGLPEVKQPSIPQQAGMLRELGFDGVGYPLWLDDQLDKNLQALDEAGLDVYLLYTSVNLLLTTWSRLTVSCMRLAIMV